MHVQADRGCGLRRKESAGPWFCVGGRVCSGLGGQLSDVLLRRKCRIYRSIKPGGSSVCWVRGSPKKDPR
jgi:hypothetical protein